MLKCEGHYCFPFEEPKPDVCPVCRACIPCAMANLKHGEGCEACMDSAGPLEQAVEDVVRSIENHRDN